VYVLIKLVFFLAAPICLSEECVSYAKKNTVGKVIPLIVSRFSELSPASAGTLPTRNSLPAMLEALPALSARPAGE
jgi:hypothetical protein